MAREVEVSVEWRITHATFTGRLQTEPLISNRRFTVHERSDRKISCMPKYCRILTDSVCTELTLSGIRCSMYLLCITPSPQSVSWSLELDEGMPSYRLLITQLASVTVFFGRMSEMWCAENGLVWPIRNYLKETFGVLLLHQIIYGARMLCFHYSWGNTLEGLRTMQYNYVLLSLC